MTMNSKYLENLATQVAAGVCVKAAASIVGCSESHAYTLAGCDEFKMRVSQLRSSITSQAVGKLSAAASQAVDVLVELMGPDNEPKDRLAAAKAVLATLGPLSDHSELRSRLDEIERAA